MPNIPFAQVGNDHAVFIIRTPDIGDCHLGTLDWHERNFRHVAPPRQGRYTEESAGRDAADSQLIK